MAKFVLAAALVLTAGRAAAQVTEAVDPALLETWRLQSGDTIRYCQYEDAPTFAFDRAVGETISERLLLASEFVTVGSSYGIGGEYAAEDLFVSLTNDCDVMLGMGLAANLYPREFTATRPYVGFSYVLAVTDPSYESLSDIPRDKRIGARVGSYGFRAMARYNATLPEEHRWQTLPYGTEDQMLTRLWDGTIAGTIIYGPTLAELAVERWEDVEQLTILSLEPGLEVELQIGGILRARNTYLRTLIDDAITDMMSDGIIETLLNEAGLEGIPAVPGGQ